MPIKFIVKKNPVTEAIGEEARQQLKALNFTKEELYAVVNSEDVETNCQSCGDYMSDVEQEDYDEGCNVFCDKCSAIDDGDELWFVCGEVYEYDEDGEPDGSITDYLYKGNEATARKKFNDWVNENHEMVKAGKGKEIEYQRYEIGYETKDDTEYVEWAWWGPECNDYDFDASYC